MILTFVLVAFALVVITQSDNNTASCTISILSSAPTGNTTHLIHSNLDDEHNNPLKPLHKDGFNSVGSSKSKIQVALSGVNPKCRTGQYDWPDYLRQICLPVGRTSFKYSQETQANFVSSSYSLYRIPMLPSIKSNFYLTTETTDPWVISDYVGGPSLLLIPSA